MKKNMEGNKQYKRVPFTIELAKKVQSGEITGRILQNNGLPATVLAFDINGKNLAVRFTRKDGTEAVSEHQPNGKVLAEWCSGSEDFALVIELLEETPKHEFKPFDKVLVRDNSGDKWVPDMFRYYDDDYPKDYPYRCCANDYKQCIPYAGNEHLLGTSNNPK